MFPNYRFSGSGLSHLSDSGEKRVALSHLLSDNVERGETFASVVNFVVLKVIQTDICILSNL